MKEKLEVIASRAPLNKNFEVIEIIEDKKDCYTIYLESLEGITIDDCATVSQFIFSQLPEDTNIELTVSSAGIDKPLRSPIQFVKNKGKRVEVKTIDGRKFIGILNDYNSNYLYLIQKIKGKEQKEIVLEKNIIKQVKIKLF